MDTGREGDGKGFPEQKLLVLELEGRSQEGVCGNGDRSTFQVGGTVHAKALSHKGAGMHGDREKASVAGVAIRGDLSKDFKYETKKRDPIL